MSRGYGKYRRGGSSFHFDNLFKENANKPSAARSAATVGKWGITSFTSIRTINGKFKILDIKYWVVLGLFRYSIKACSCS